MCSLKEFIMDVLAMVGGSVIVITVFLALSMLWEYLTDQIDMAKYSHKRKHRFDKPPTAKCYCKDCDRYETDVEYCNRFSRYVLDSDFCSYAKPRKRDPEKMK